MPRMSTLDIDDAIKTMPASRRDLARNLHMLTTRYCSATELARAIGKHSADVSRWIRGLSNPGIDTVDAIAAAFGLKMHEFLDPQLADLIDDGDVSISAP